VSIVRADVIPTTGSIRRGHRFPLLVADIGGTNARFAWMANAHAGLSQIETLTCEQFPAPEDAANAYLRMFHAGALPAHAAIAIASAITAGPIKVTNSHWVLDRSTFAKATGIASVEVFNDFEAIALVLPYLTQQDYRLVGTVQPIETQPMAVIGPGTGLGVGGITPIRGHAGRWQTVCGEGGHMTLSGSTEYQNEILRVTREQFPHVSAERLISGIGLPTLRRAVARVEGIAISHDLNAEEIGTLGSTRADRLCERTMDAFCTLLGCVAGNVALTLGARGGVFIGGGIVPKLGAFFHESGFRTHFEAKGRYENYLREIATAVVTAPFPGLLGLAHNAAHEGDV
jgi:glucokinase